MGGPVIEVAREGATDTNIALDQFLSGQVEKSVNTISDSIGGKGPTKTYGLEKVALQKSKEEAAAATAASAQEKTDKIQTRLSEEIRLRQKTPGKSQTLLTAGVAPSSTNTGTLLTGAKR